MSPIEIIPCINLQLFGEGAGGEGAGTGAEGTTGVSEGASQPSTKGAKNPLADVKYGIQDSQDAAVSATNDGVPDRNAEFEKLIKGEYKDLYDARVQDTVQRRLKNSKETEERYNALTPMLEMLGRKYGVDANDTAALSKAIEDDDSYYEDEALEKGVTVEQLKSIRKMERENANLKKQMQEKANRERAEKDVAVWMEQANDARRTFPNLDLGTELKNPQFVSLLKSGVDVSTAYFALHNRELVPQAMQYTANAVKQKLVNNVIANGARPVESGANPSSSSVVKSDVSKLTKEDRKEIAKRVARGDKIKF